MLRNDPLFPRHSPHPLDGQVFEAIAAEDIAHLEALFSAGARANAIHPRQGVTALSAAVRQDSERARQLSRAGVSHSALSCSTSDIAVPGSPALSLCLLERGADVNGVGSCGETALMTAAGQGSLSLVTLLLESGARVEAISDDGDTALSLAAGATEWVVLSEAGVERGITRQTNGLLEQLRPIAEAQAIAVVEQLLAAGARLNRPGCIATPLMEAARYGQLKLLSLLLKRGADPRLGAKDGQTALGIAKLYNQARAQTLLEAYLSEDDAKRFKPARIQSGGVMPGDTASGAIDSRGIEPGAIQSRGIEPEAARPETTKPVFSATA